MKRSPGIFGLLPAIALLLGLAAAAWSAPTAPDWANQKHGFLDDFMRRNWREELSDKKYAALLQEARQPAGETPRVEALLRSAQLYQQALHDYAHCYYSIQVRFYLIKIYEELNERTRDDQYHAKAIATAQESVKEINEWLDSGIRSPYLEWSRSNLVAGAIVRLGGPASPGDLKRAREFCLDALQTHLAPAEQYETYYRLIMMAFYDKDLAGALDYARRGLALAAEQAGRFAPAAVRAPHEQARKQFMIFAAQAAMLKGDKGLERHYKTELAALAPAEKGAIERELEIMRQGRGIKN